MFVHAPCFAAITTWLHPGGLLVSSFVDEETVSVATLALHYGQYRWTLERAAAMRFTGLWERIGASKFQERDKERLTAVIWALASLERAFQVLEADAKRAEEVENHGAPAVMTFLSGPYAGSLHYLLGTGLWMDLGEVLTAYRALVDRLRRVLDAVRAGRLPLTEEEYAAELAALDGRRLPELGDRSIRKMVDNLLHEAWHPTTPGVAFDWAWSGDEGQRKVNFTDEGDLRESLFQLMSETVDQIVALVQRLTLPDATG